jgi:hypothetical protein
MDNRHFDEMNDDWSEYKKSSRKKQKHRNDEKRKDYEYEHYGHEDKEYRRHRKALVRR